MMLWPSRKGNLWGCFRGDQIAAVLNLYCFYPLIKVCERGAKITEDATQHTSL